MAVRPAISLRSENLGPTEEHETHCHDEKKECSHRTIDVGIPHTPTNTRPDTQAGLGSPAQSTVVKGRSEPGNGHLTRFFPRLSFFQSIPPQQNRRLLGAFGIPALSVRLVRAQMQLVRKT